MVVPDALVLPVNFFRRIIEGVSSTHFKDGHVSPPGRPDKFNVSEADAWLADHEGVGRGRHRALCDVRLKIVDGSADKVHVVSPSGDHRIRRNPSVAFLREIVHELNPHLRNSVAPLRWRISDESVGLAGCLPTCLLVRLLRPKVALA